MKQPRKWAFLDRPVPFGFAHQGGTDVAPGNTMAAFEHAVSLGYTYLETDVRVTSDGVLVVFHDDDLEPATGVAGTIEERSWEEVSRLRVGGEHPIPRFVDLVDRFPDARLNIDPKADSAVDPLVAIVQEHGILDRICIGSFSDRRLARVRRLLGAGLAMSPGPVGLAKVLAAAVAWPRWRPPYACVQIPARYGIVPLSSGWLVRRIQRLGLQVHVWTINTEPEMGALLDNGVDAIMSDRVALLAEVLRSRT
jgi:glycerophosphoryl diester phosphodiesterase